MLYIFMGFVAFLFFFLYDINSIIMKIKLLKGCFFIGFLVLIAATVGIVITSLDLITIDVFRIAIFGAGAILFLCLLIYTLFFALPFTDTYIEAEDTPKVCESGVYALCRHPGVLWFIGFYIFFGMALNLSLLLYAAVFFSGLNILYVIFQDKWTFMKMFANYDTYKINTPFLFPNLKSIKHCLQTL